MNTKSYLLKLKLPIVSVAFLFIAFTGALAKDYGDAFVSGAISDARTLVPILASDSASADVCGMIFNGLVKYDRNINLVGDLAESWDISEGGKVITFHLRKDAFWQDGQPFSAGDVEFTYKKLIDPEVKTPYSGDFQIIESFEVLDEYTVRVRYKEPFSPGLSSWGMSIMPKHLLEKEDLNRTEFARNPIGTGPYKFAFWKSQQSLILQSFHHYFEGRPFIDRYIFRVIPDTSTMFLELQTEGLDLAGISPLQFTRQTDTVFFQKNYRKLRLPGFSYIYMGYNLKDPKFSDKRVRQALNYAVDKNEIVDIVLLGLGKVITGPFIPESWAYNKEVKPVSFDRKKALWLLRQAGWEDTDSDGWLDKEGRNFEFTIVTNQGNEERYKVAQIIQGRLEEIGIKVKIKVVEWSVFLSEFIDKRNFEAVLLGWSLSRDPDSYDIWHSSKTKEGEFNFVGFCDEWVDEYLVKARRSFDQKERAYYYHKIHEIIYDEQPYMFLYAPDSLVMLHRRFRGVDPGPIGIGYNFIEWWVPQEQQKYRSFNAYYR